MEEQEEEGDLNTVSLHKSEGTIDIRFHSNIIGPLIATRTTSRRRTRRMENKKGEVAI
jgi:hypothetical protein